MSIHKLNVRCKPLLGSSSGSALQYANSDQVTFTDRANVLVAQADERLCLAGCQHELDFKTIGVVHVDNGAEIATTQTVLRQVSVQNDGVEEIEHG